MNSFENYFSLYETTDPPPIITDGYRKIYDNYHNNLIDYTTSPFNTYNSINEISPKVQNMFNQIYKLNGITSTTKQLNNLGVDVSSLEDAQVGDFIYTPSNETMYTIANKNNNSVSIKDSEGNISKLAEDVSHIRRVTNSPNQYIIDYFISKGLTRDQARGIYGNIMQESGGDPKAISKDGHNSYGLAQWTGDRKRRLFKMYGTNPTAEQQLDFLWWELNNTHKNVLKQLKATSTVREATKIFMDKFEVPHPDYARFNNRLNYANSI